MALVQRPGPSMPIPKKNGKWTFHVYPSGVPKEAGEFDTEELAAVAAHKVLLIWEANNHTYGPLGTITSQSNFITG